MKIWTDLFSVLSGITRVTDGQTDRQTDGRTEFSSLYRVCITCSEIKMENIMQILLEIYVGYPAVKKF